MYTALYTKPIVYIVRYFVQCALLCLFVFWKKMFSHTDTTFANYHI